MGCHELCKEGKRPPRRTMRKTMLKFLEEMEMESAMEAVSVTTLPLVFAVLVVSSLSFNCECSVNKIRLFFT